MRTLALVLATTAGAPSGPVALNAAELAVYPDAADMPAEVQDFIVRWQDCNHWLGEDGVEEARRRQIEEAIRQSCHDIDARGRRVRERHANDAAVLARIAEYEVLGR